MKNIFVYKTLRSETTVRDVLGHDKEEIPFTLCGWSREQCSGPGGYETLVPEADGSTSGAVIVCTAEEAAKLAAWEDGYELRAVGTFEGDPLYAFIRLERDEKRKSVDSRFKSCISEVKSFDDNALTLKHWISTESQDDGGDIMMADGMERRGNIVVDFEHGKDPVKGVEPIAKCLGLETGVNAKGKKGLIATTRFFDDEQGRRLYRKAKELYMPNWSIEWEPIPGGNFPVKGGTRHDKWRLLAYSLVKLGMNEDATADAGLKFLIQEQPVHGRRTTLAAEVGARVAHAALVTAHECLVAAMHAKCHDAACADAPEEIADRLVSEHAPILKEHIADFVSCYRVLAAERPCKSLIEFTAMFGGRRRRYRRRQRRPRGQQRLHFRAYTVKRRTANRRPARSTPPRSPPESRQRLKRMSTNYPAPP